MLESPPPLNHARCHCKLLNDFPMHFFICHRPLPSPRHKALKTSARYMLVPYCQRGMSEHQFLYNTYFFYSYMHTFHNLIWVKSGFIL